MSALERGTIRNADDAPEAPLLDTLPAKARFGRCTCGHMIYDHTRRTLPSGGGQEYVGCRSCECARFAASDGSRWPDGAAGVAA